MRLPMLSLALSLVLPRAVAQDQPKPQQDSSRLLTTKGTLLFAHPKEQIILETMNVSDNGKIAFVLKMKDGRERVMLNGVGHKPYPNIVPVDVLAAARSLNNQQQAALRASRGALSQIIRFTPNFERAYYIAYTGKGYLIASDKYESKLYDVIMDGNPVISADSKKIAFAGGRNGRWFVVLNDSESKDYDDLQVGTLVFSANSERLAYCARKSSEWRVFTTDGAAHPAMEGIAEGSLTFSPDSKRLAYVAFNKQNKMVVMIDGRPCGEFDAIGEGTLSFSPDSQHLAFAAKSKGKWFVQVDEKSYGPYDAVIERTPVFNKDSKRVVWAAETSHQWLVYENGKELTIPAAEKKKPEPMVVENIFKGTPVFSPDGKRLAIGMKKQGKWILWSDGQESQPFDELRPASLRFTWDSSKLAFVGIRDQKFVPVINFKEYPASLDISPTRVSGADTSGTIAFAVKRSRTPEEMAEAKKKDPEAGETYWKILVNGEELYGPYNNVQAGALSVSWDGARFALPAQIKDEWSIFINDEKKTDGLPIWIRFHPDTHLMEMIAVTPEGYLFVKEVYE